VSKILSTCDTVADDEVFGCGNIHMFFSL
jgi:hypothetical protein